MALARKTDSRRPGAWRVALWLALGSLLLLPAVAMQFTSEVAWDKADFAAAALLLGGTGLAFEIGFRLTSSRAYRVVMGLTIAVAAGLI